MRRVLLLMPWLLLCLMSCRRPASYEVFIKGPAARYDFTLDLSDSTCSYDIGFYTRLDRALSRRDSLPASFPLHIRWTGPSGQTFEETVHYPTAEIRVPYRSGIIPVENGSWTLSVTLPDPPRKLRGLGIICHYGTR